eukprot:8349676-Alexandrium_andersonii.AAC.1
MLRKLEQHELARLAANIAGCGGTFRKASACSGSEVSLIAAVYVLKIFDVNVEPQFACEIDVKKQALH